MKMIKHVIMFAALAAAAANPVPSQLPSDIPSQVPSDEPSRSFVPSASQVPSDEPSKSLQPSASEPPSASEQPSDEPSDIPTATEHTAVVRTKFAVKFASGITISTLDAEIKKIITESVLTRRVRHLLSRDLSTSDCGVQSLSTDIPCTSAFSPTELSGFSERFCASSEINFIKTDDNACDANAAASIVANAIDLPNGFFETVIGLATPAVVIRDTDCLDAVGTIATVGKGKMQRKATCEWVRKKPRRCKSKKHGKTYVARCPTVCVPTCNCEDVKKRFSFKGKNKGFRTTSCKKIFKSNNFKRCDNPTIYNNCPQTCLLPQCTKNGAKGILNTIGTRTREERFGAKNNAGRGTGRRLTNTYMS